MSAISPLRITRFAQLPRHAAEVWQGGLVRRSDWAIVMVGPEEDGMPVLYLVSETKSSPKKDDLRPNEWRRIQCGAAHFGSRQFNRRDALEGVDYCVVKEAAELPSVQP